MRTTLKASLAILTLAFLGGGFWLVYTSDDKEDSEAVVESGPSFGERLFQARTVESLLILEGQLAELSDLEQEQYRPLLTLALAQYYYDVAEKNIFRAQSILEATAGAINEDGINPIAQRYIDIAFDYYQKAKERIDSIREMENDSDFNFHLYYTRGNIYFRYLLFIAGREEAQEIFNQTAIAWGRALLFREKDINTEINLEILRRDRGTLLQGAIGNRHQRIRMLPDRGVGQGGGHGIH